MKQKKKPDKQNQKALALWAANCAKKALPLFEKQKPRDERPRKAIKAANDWAKGLIGVGEARKAAFGAHAAARSVSDSAAKFAARSAGHAAATAHVAKHAEHAAGYAKKAILAKKEKPLRR